MKQLKEKLNSQRGASILLALLFLLVCMMAAASVLMSAATNAGKAHSSRQEQQRYFTLSSAVRLVCATLDGATYQGAYDYTRTDHPAETNDLTGEILTPAYSTHTLKQTKGTFAFQQLDDTQKTSFSIVLPLADDLDTLFSKRFREENISNAVSGDEIKATAQFGQPIVPHSMTLTVKTDAAAEGEAGAQTLSGLTNQPVTVQVEVQQATGKILITASLTADGYTSRMHAELEPDRTLSSVLNPEIPSGKAEADGDGSDPSKVHTESITWHLTGIEKG